MAFLRLVPFGGLYSLQLFWLPTWQINIAASNGPQQTEERAAILLGLGPERTNHRKRIYAVLWKITTPYRTESQNSESPLWGSLVNTQITDLPKGGWGLLRTVKEDRNLQLKPDLAQNTLCLWSEFWIKSIHFPSLQGTSQRLQSLCLRGHLPSQEAPPPDAVWCVCTRQEPCVLQLQCGEQHGDRSGSGCRNRGGTFSRHGLT